MIRIGIIGAGRIGQVHARSVAGNPDTQLSVVADLNEDAAKAVADPQGARTTTDIDSVFTADDVDAVIICSPTPLHVPHILAAVEAGKPALCEKPVAMEMDAVNDLLAKLEGKDYKVLMGFNRRFDPSFRKINDETNKGTIGQLEQLTIISRDPAAPPKEYIAVSGGVFKDMTIHDFDMARFFLGDIKSVVAIGQNLDPELADTGDFDGAVITLTNAEGHTATITNSRHCASGYDQRLEAFGTEGALFAENIRPTTVRLSNAEVTDAQEPYLDFFLERYEAAYEAELAELVAAINENRAPSPSVVDGAEALRIAEAAATSAKEGRIVTL